MTSTARQTKTAYLLLLGVVLVWSSTFTLIKRALDDCSPLLFNQLRMLLAAAVLVLVNARALRGMTRRGLVAGIIAGVLLALGYELQTAGLALTTPVKNAFFTGLVVVMVPMLGVVPRLRAQGAHAPGWATVAGTGLAAVGIVLLTTPPGTPMRALLNGINRGDVLTLCCALAFALHLVWLSLRAREVPAAQLATVQIAAAGVAMTIATPALEKPHMVLSGPVLLALGVTAVFATALAFSVQTWAQRHLPAMHTALVLSLEPAFAWVIALLFFHEPLTLRSAGGALLMLGGLLVSELLTPAAAPADGAAMPVTGAA